VAVLVVVGLEVVEVDQGKAQRLAGADRPRQLARELLVPGPPVGHPGEAVGAGQAANLPVEGADLGEQPQQGAEQDAGRDPHAQHQRGRDGALGQDRVARQGGVAQGEPGVAEGEAFLAHIRAAGPEAGREAGQQAGRGDPVVVQLHAGGRQRGPQRLREEVAGPELPGRPAEEAGAPLGDGGVLDLVDGDEQLERHRPSRLGQVEVAGECRLVAQGGPGAVAGPFQGGQDARGGAGVGRAARW
jgi:hypothetical protein